MGCFWVFAKGQRGLPQQAGGMFAPTLNRASSKLTLVRHAKVALWMKLQAGPGVELAGGQGGLLQQDEDQHQTHSTDKVKGERMREFRPAGRRAGWRAGGSAHL